MGVVDTLLSTRNLILVFLSHYGFSSSCYYCYYYYYYYCCSCCYYYPPVSSSASSSSVTVLPGVPVPFVPVCTLMQVTAAAMLEAFNSANAKMNGRPG